MSRSRKRSAWVIACVVIATAPLFGTSISAQAESHAGATHDSRYKAGLSSTDAVLEVKAIWRQPRIHCRAGDTSGMRIQLVLGRPTYGDQVSIGTEAHCDHQVPVYYGWRQWLGSDEPVKLQDIRPGWRVRVILRYERGSVFGGFTVYCPHHEFCGSNDISGPHSDGFSTGSIAVHTVGRGEDVPPLADFGTVYFRHAEMNNAPVNEIDPTVWRMVGDTGTVLAVSSGIHPDGDFAVS